MKTNFVLLALLLLPCAGWSSPVAESDVVTAVNDSRVEANLKQAKFRMGKGDYVGAIKNLNRVLELDPSNSEARSLLQECNRHIEAQRRREREAFETAYNQEGIDALKRFVTTYPNSEYIKQARNRIADYDLWQSCKRLNTKEAYENYKKTSTIKSYTEEANKAIQNLESLEAWERVSRTQTIDGLQGFITQYPFSEKVNVARYLLYVKQGEQAYRQNKKDLAFSKYEDAMRFFSLSGDALRHYNDIKLDRQVRAMASSTDEKALISFLNDIPYTQSQHRNTISNRIAILKARALTTSSSSYDCDLALRYAKDASVHRQVERYISDMEAQKKRERRRYLAYAHSEWWKRNQLVGINIGFDVFTNTLCWKAGLRYRLGISEDVFNISIGADYVGNYSLIDTGSSYDYSYSYYDYGSSSNVDEEHIADYIEVPLTMKFNFADGYRESNFYIGISGTYGFRINASGKYRHLTNKNVIAIEPCLGYNWGKFDIGLSYKYYLKDYNVTTDDFEYQSGLDFDQHRVGMYMALYF